MSRLFPKTLSTIKVGSHVLKSRIIAPHALPHYLQGPETYPAEPIIAHMANLARNGAAIVGCNCWDDTGQRIAGGTASHFPMYDYSNPATETYVCKMVDCIHFYGSLASVYIAPNEMDNFQPLADPSINFFDRFHLWDSVAEIPVERLHWMAAETARKCKYFKTLGFDMVSLHMGGREMGHGGVNKFISPLSNDRKDEYGGSVENRYRLALEICAAVKEACGPDFLIDLWVAGEEEPGGITVSDTVAFAKMAEGLVDILQIRGGNINPVHPTGFNSEPAEPGTLHVAKAVKQSGAKLIVAAAGGYGDPKLNERFLTEGSLDMVAIGRQFICDDEYGIKLMEDRPEDIVPCQRCAKCHVPYPGGPWTFICSGNPKMGLYDRIERMVFPPKRIKKVAVIGGGVAGIEAALECAKRGHSVTLFEKSGALGGQLLHADHPKFKWPLKNFKDYLLCQIEKSPVELRMNTAATPEGIRSEGFDAVICAVGSIPGRAELPGASLPNVWSPVDVYGREAELGQKVAVVGGGDIGTETALYLAECGHEVTVLTRQVRIAPDATCTHYREMFEERWQTLPNFHIITDADTTEFSENGVSYRDILREAPPEGVMNPGTVAVGKFLGYGETHELECGSIVFAGKRQALADEALAFEGAAGEFYMVGDCTEPGSVQKCMRTAFAAASRI